MDDSMAHVSVLMEEWSRVGKWHILEAVEGQVVPPSPPVAEAGWYEEWRTYCGLTDENTDVGGIGPQWVDLTEAEMDLDNCRNCLRVFRSRHVVNLTGRP